MSEMSAPTRVLDYAGSAPLDAVVRRISRLAVAAFILSGLSIALLLDQREINFTLVAVLKGQTHFLIDSQEAFDRVCIICGAPVVASLVLSAVAMGRIARRDTGLRGGMLAIAGITLCVSALVVLVFVRSHTFTATSSPCGCKTEPRYSGAVN